jgi:hypothetical protein
VRQDRIDPNGGSNRRPRLALVHGDAPDPGALAELERRSQDDVCARLSIWIDRLPDGSRWRAAYERGRDVLERYAVEEDR